MYNIVFNARESCRIRFSRTLNLVSTTSSALMYAEPKHQDALKTHLYRL